MNWESELNELKENFSIKELSKILKMSCTSLVIWKKNKKVNPSSVQQYRIHRIYQDFKKGKIVVPFDNWHNQLLYLLERYSKTDLAKKIKTTIVSISLWSKKTAIPRPMSKTKINKVYEQIILEEKENEN